jgi:hypothetical protein
MEYDASYKLLFSHARMVEELLRGFVHETWVRAVDFTSLERVGGKLKRKLEEQDTSTPWWEQIVGTFENDPIYDHAMRLGRQYRQSVRPRPLRAVPSSNFIMVVLDTDHMSVLERRD